jgi:ABC-2 type transport system ATP-binding protein
MPVEDYDMSEGSLIELAHICKSYGDFAAVRDVSLAVEPGMILGLLGPNGAGKTSTIRMIMDVIAPDRGEILFFGRARQEGDLRRVGYLPEERGLYQKMSVGEQLLFFARLRGLPRREARGRIDAWLERVGLAEWKERKVEELSKGMQQKIQLVSTVLHDPDVLVLDEPFSGLDPINQGLFKDLLSEYKGRGKAILFSTHVMEQAEKLCDHLCLISKGRVVLEGGWREIQHRYGGTAFRVEATGDLERLAGLPGIDQARLVDGSLRIVLAPRVEPSEVLRAMLEHVEVREFRSEAPELEEIFIRAVEEAG